MADDDSTRDYRALFDKTRMDQWATDCLTWRGHVLGGRYAHWCIEWDGLPIDETTPEWPCGCGIKDYIDNGQQPRREAGMISTDTKMAIWFLVGVLTGWAVCHAV